MTHYFEDMPVGFRFTTASKEVTREAVIGFARDWDPQPFHLDDAAAAQTHFGKISASGWHTLLIAFNLGLDSGVWNDASLGASGLDEVRWIKPVYPGDTLHAENEVVAAERSKSRPHYGRLRVRTDVINQDGEMVASFVSNALMRTRA